MKHYLLMTIACLGLIVFTPGMTCRNGTTSAGVAARTLQGVQTAVDSAMRVYGTAVVTGRVSVEKQVQIDAAHAKYREAFRLALTASQGNLDFTAPENVIQLASQLQILITSL